MTATAPEGWLTAEDLAAEWKQDVRWVKDHMASGEIPTVKVGRHRFFTPECRAQMVAAQLKNTEPTAAETWGRPVRGRAS